MRHYLLDLTSGQEYVVADAAEAAVESLCFQVNQNDSDADQVDLLLRPAQRYFNELLTRDTSI